MNNPVSSSRGVNRRAFTVAAVIGAFVLAWGVGALSLRLGRAFLASLPATAAAAPDSPDAVTLKTRDDVELRAIAPIDGFVALVNQPGLILLFHGYTGTCYLSPMRTTPFVEVAPEVCDTVRKRQGDKGRS